MTGRVERVKEANRRLVPLIVSFAAKAIGLGGVSAAFALAVSLFVPSSVAWLFVMVAVLFLMIASTGVIALIALGLHLAWTTYLLWSYRRDATP